VTRRPVHPGEILADELEAIGLSSAELARTLDIPANRISQIIAGKRSITADTARSCFGASPEFWINLQARYDLKLPTAPCGTKSSARSRPETQPDCEPGFKQ
jgi:addiction module HigA family antidote